MPSLKIKRLERVGSLSFDAKYLLLRDIKTVILKKGETKTSFKAGDVITISVVHPVQGSKDVFGKEMEASYSVCDAQITKDTVTTSLRKIDEGIIVDCGYIDLIEYMTTRNKKPVIDKFSFVRSLIDQWSLKTDKNPYTPQRYTSESLVKIHRFKRMVLKPRTSPLTRFL